MPKTTCSAAASGIAPGVLIVAGPTSGETLDAAALILQCGSGSLSITPTWVLGSTESYDTTHTVHTGDSIHLSVSVGTGGTTVVVQDLTAARAFTDT